MRTLTAFVLIIKLQKNLQQQLEHTVSLRSKYLKRIHMEPSVQKSCLTIEVRLQFKMADRLVWGLTWNKKGSDLVKELLK